MPEPECVHVANQKELDAEIQRQLDPKLGYRTGGWAAVNAPEGGPVIVLPAGTVAVYGAMTLRGQGARTLLKNAGTDTVFTGTCDYGHGTLRRLVVEDMMIESDLSMIFELDQNTVRATENITFRGVTFRSQRNVAVDMRLPDPVVRCYGTKFLDCDFTNCWQVLRINGTDTEWTSRVQGSSTAAPRPPAMLEMQGAMYLLGGKFDGLWGGIPMFSVRHHANDDGIEQWPSTLTYTAGHVEVEGAFAVVQAGSIVTGIAPEYVVVMG